MSNSFKQDDVFPLIFRLITDQTNQDSEYISHTDLVDLLLSDVDGAEIVAVAEAKNKFDTRTTASNMVAFFSQRYTIGENDFGMLLERKQVNKTWAYRSKERCSPSPNHPSLSAIDVDASAFEGNQKLQTHIVRERDPKLVLEKLARVKNETGRLACECCGFDAQVIFPGIDSAVVEVHHRTLLSKYKGEMETKLEDLSLLCPTCHRAIHRKVELTVEELRAWRLNAH